MKWLPWHKRMKEADDAVSRAEHLRDQAQAQQRKAEKLTPRIDAVSSSLQQLRTDNHFGPMIDAILRGSE